MNSPWYAYSSQFVEHLSDKTIYWGELPSEWRLWVLGVLVISLVFFLVALWPKGRVLGLAESESRWNHLGQRFRNTLWIAFGQSKMFKDGTAGWMHALIFWGFLVLLLRALQYFMLGMFPIIGIFSLYYETGFFGHAYILIKDVFVLLVTLACLYALYRRLITKPKRLNLSGEGILILGLILLIMLSDILFESALASLDIHNADLSLRPSCLLAGLYPTDFTLMNPSAPEGNACAFLGMSLAEMGLKNISPDSLKDTYNFAYWTHILSILIFLVILPRSKHFHIITSIPNVFLGNVTQTGNQLSRIDFEDESKETFGVTRIEEFSWKKLLDLHTCTECGRCDVFCPALNSDKPLSPKQFTIDLRNHLNAQTPALLNKEGSESPVLMGGAIQDATVWACTTCGACEEECPVMIEYVNKMVDLRRGLVLTEDRYPKELGEAFKSLETHSNPWGFPGTQRTDWAEGLEIKQWDKDNPTEYLYFVGCNGSFDSRGKKVSESVVRALQKAGVDFSILGNREGCTGDPARRLGNEYLFDMLASQNAETLKEQGVIKVIVHCPHCFNSFKHE
jgi:ferredoxin